uniref:Uncharacterized protein n=1 Tax=Corseley virus TaxID=1807806 RepID=A0A140HEQ1_9VIRU|nr:hypothetical protein 1 [Corseley virus]
MSKNTSRKSTQRRNHSSLVATSTYGPQKTPKVNSYRGGQGSPSVNKLPLSPACMQHTISELVKNLQQAQQEIKELRLKLAEVQTPVKAVEPVVLGANNNEQCKSRASLAPGLVKLNSAISLPVNAHVLSEEYHNRPERETQSLGKNFKFENQNRFDVLSVEDEPSLISETDSGIATDASETSENKKKPRNLPKAGKKSVQATLNAGPAVETDKPIKHQVERKFITKPTWRSVLGVGKRRVIEKTNDEELADYLKYMFAFQPRTTATLASMVYKARIFMESFDLTKFDYDELHVIIVNAVNSAMRVPKCETLAIESIERKDVNKMAKHSAFVREGIAAQPKLFGLIKAKTLVPKHA